MTILGKTRSSHRLIWDTTINICWLVRDAEFPFSLDLAAPSTLSSSGRDASCELRKKELAANNTALCACAVHFGGPLGERETPR